MIKDLVSGSCFQIRSATPAYGVAWANDHLFYTGRRSLADRMSSCGIVSAPTHRKTLWSTESDERFWLGVEQAGMIDGS